MTRFGRLALALLVAALLAFGALRPAIDCGECKPCCKPAPTEHTSIRARMACCEPGRVVEPAPQPPSRTDEAPTVLASLPTQISPPLIARISALAHPVSAPQRTMPLFQRLLL